MANLSKISMFVYDFKCAWRWLIINPMITTIIIISLAIVIGPCAALFGVTDQVFLSGSAKYLPESFMELYAKYPTANSRNLLYKEYYFLRQYSNSFSEIVATMRIGGILSINGVKEAASIETVSTNYFSILLTNMEIGRKFTLSDDVYKENIPVIISYSLWQRKFNSSSEIIGKSFSLGNRTVEVIGVVEHGFRGLGKVATVDFWVPMECWFIASPFKNEMLIDVFVMPRNGIMMSQYDVEFNNISKELYKQYPDIKGNYEIIHTYIKNERMRLLYGITIIIFCLSLAIMAIAWINVCTLLLSRSIDRQKEVAIRISSGASRWQLLRLFFMEGFLISSASCVLSILLTYFLINITPVLLKSPLFPSSSTFTINPTILIFSILMSLFTIMLFMLFQVKQTSEKSIINILKSDSGKGTKKSYSFKFLFLIQIIIVHAVLSGAGLILANHYDNIKKVNLGFDSEKKLILITAIPQMNDNNSRPEVDYMNLVDHIMSIPGVDNVTYLDQLPLDLSGNFMKYNVELGKNDGDMSIANEISVSRVGLGFFDVFGTTIIQGHSFEYGDKEEHNIVIINRYLAELAFPEVSNPSETIGRFLKIQGHENLRIIGITEDGKYMDLRKSRQPFMYVPAPTVSEQPWVLAIEVHEKYSKFLVEDTTKCIYEVEPSLFLLPAKTLQEHIKEADFTNIIGVRLMISIGSIALFVTSIGLGGFSAYWIKKSRRELGIRMALGATRIDIIKYIEFRFLIPLFIGILLGTIIVRFVSRLIPGFILETNIAEFTSYFLSALFIFATIITTTLIPTIKASMANPNAILRKE